MTARRTPRYDRSWSRAFSTRATAGPMARYAAGSRAHVEASAARARTHAPLTTFWNELRAASLSK